jgi:hypothetical protein
MGMPQCVAAVVWDPSASLIGEPASTQVDQEHAINSLSCSGGLPEREARVTLEPMRHDAWPCPVGRTMGGHVRQVLS